MLRREAVRQAGQRSGHQPGREPAVRSYADALPIVPVRARGLTVEGADGRRYLDCLSGAGTLALGHNHPVVLEAIRKVLDSGAPLSVPDLATPLQEAFITELFRTLPPGLADRARVRFCGPADRDAVEAAFSLARSATGRTGILVSTGASAEAELDAGRPQFLLDDATPGRPLPAAVVLEPVRGDGGTIPASDDWLRRIRQITADRSIPLIADEIQTGVGRTGAFWAVEHSGITPDLMILSKAIGGSLPLAVVVYRDDLDVSDCDAPVGAFRGNQLAMAAGTATLAHVRENGLAEHAARLGSRMLGQLHQLQGEFACVGDVRGRGLMIGVELVDPDDGTDGGTDDETDRAAGAASSRIPGPGPSQLAFAVQRECLRRGLIVELGGAHSTVVRLLPPLTISDEQAAAVLDRLTDAVATVARGNGDAVRRSPRPRGGCTGRAV
ncbi:aminotransferase class III-fold pyridoxal phosphate-dependent enzyme [Streptomyces sp. NPDC046805]|uniref:aminotransferase class III-fold pyridoxal phosphate-dependent enzyme n=1 Tax=Streptomyces sp. NPDC046805 TaxID=3155134 RepID=UPI00340DD9BC